MHEVQIMTAKQSIHGAERQFILPDKFPFVDMAEQSRNPKDFHLISILKQIPVIK